MSAAALRLLTPDAVRERCALVLAAAERDALAHFACRPERLEEAAALVVDATRRAYPDLAIPYHSRWRHFVVEGHDRWAELAAPLALGREEKARARFDLAVTSVLLDAGAGPAWRWVDPRTGAVLARSEGLALASLEAFAQGLFSSRAAEPLRADAEALMALDDRALAEAFQVTGANPLVGLEGRVALLNRLGATIARDPERFGREARVGRLLDHLADQADGGRLEARAVLRALLLGLGPIWPGRLEQGGVNLGDTGRHPAARTGDATSGLVPFHKLSQWLAYSLIEPLEEAGMEVEGLDALTALAEYRNGGLLIDTGVLVPKHDAVLGEAHAATSEVVVEWRALTVVLIDRLAHLVRAQLGLTAAQLPLAKVLQGGTWSAGRRIARELRPDGAPPLRVLSDGTVF
jgi:hypothetical protein